MAPHSLPAALGFAALVSGCGGPGGADTAAYRPPDLARLAASARVRTPEAPWRDQVPRSIENERDTDTRKAFRAALAKAQAEGIEELYGFEVYAVGGDAVQEDDYVVRTKNGSFALLAREDWSEFRADKATVPFVPMAPEAVRALGDEIASRLPLGDEADFSSDAADREVVLVAVYRDGRADSALWYAPTRGGPGDAVAAIVEKIRAAMPREFFPAEDGSPEETYGKLKGY
jgi:hypothetical protein